MKSIMLMLIALAAWSGNQVLEPAAEVDERPKERLVVDVDRSIIQWKGTKFWGMGKHEGVVRLAEGSIFVREGAIVAGRFVIDMTTSRLTNDLVDDRIELNLLLVADRPDES